VDHGVWWCGGVVRRAGGGEGKTTGGATFNLQRLTLRAFL